MDANLKKLAIDTANLAEKYVAAVAAHSVAHSAVTEDRNELAGKAYALRCKLEVKVSEVRNA